MMSRGASLAWLTAGTVGVAVLAANIHLAYVAFASQPRCVSHLRTGETAPFGYTAAKSSC